MCFRLLVLPLAALLVAACTSGGSPGPATQPTPPGPVRSSPASAASWPLFGYDAARSNTFDGDTGIAARDLGQLRREQVELPGTADSSPIYVRGRLLVTTSYGKVAAIDPSTGSLDWTFVPDGIQGWEGASQITQSSPAADPEEGDNLVLVATGGYFGDVPPYQGHVVAVDRRSGRLANVFNTLCSAREGLLDPASCPESGSAVWGRGGVVVDPESGNLLVATGDGEWDGSTYWGDSVLVLSPDAGELYASYTPDNEQALDDGDVDLASSSPAVVPPHFVVQGGKDGLVRLLDLGKLGRGVQGHEADVVDAPGGKGVFTAPAVWRTSTATWIFLANAAGTAGYVLEDSTLDQRWETATPGTSPVLAGGLLYVYDPGGSGLHVYDPRTGHELGVLPAGRGHWNSPIVVDGVVALPEGNANDQHTRGTLNIYRLP